MFSTRIATQIYAKICFETTPGQKKIIEKLSEYLADDDFSRIFVLNGYAGTGKTTLIAGLVGALKDLGIKPVLLAPTGRAAKVLAQYAQEKTLTIHKRIYRQRTNADYESKFSLNINPERGAVFIVDEASMLSDNTQGGAVFGSGSLLSDLVEYVRSGRGCRLVLVGDSAQLPPVGADFSPALDPVSMDAYGGIVYGTMDEVVRQEAQSGILFNATLVRCMLENGLYEIPRFEMDFPDIEAVVGGEFLEKLQDCYARYGRDETIVITRSNKRANRYNEGIRRNVLYAEEEIESGDMLMVVKNNYYFRAHRRLPDELHRQRRHRAAETPQTVRGFLWFPLRRRRARISRLQRCGDRVQDSVGYDRLGVAVAHPGGVDAPFLRGGEGLHGHQKQVETL